MRKTGDYPLRRVLAFILALLLIVNIIPGSAMTVLAVNDLTITQTFEFTKGLGDHVSTASEVKITITNNSGTSVVDSANGPEVRFKGDAGTYNYSISADAYGRPITGSFEVTAPAAGVTEVKGKVSVAQSFDEVTDQFTEITVSGTITDGTSGVSGLTVTGYYGAEGGTEAFKATTNAQGAYSQKVKINKNITITVTDEVQGKYEKFTQQLSIGTQDIVDNNVTVAVTQKAVTIESIDPNIIDTATIKVNQVPLTTPVMVNYGEDCQIEFTEKDDVTGRYTSTYTVNDGDRKSVV